MYLGIPIPVILHVRPVFMILCVPQLGSAEAEAGLETKTTRATEIVFHVKAEKGSYLGAFYYIIALRPKTGAGLDYHNQLLSPPL